MARCFTICTGGCSRSFRRGWSVPGAAESAAVAALAPWPRPSTIFSLSPGPAETRSPHGGHRQPGGRRPCPFRPFRHLRQRGIGAYCRGIPLLSRLPGRSRRRRTRQQGHALRRRHADLGGEDERHLCRGHGRVSGQRGGKTERARRRTGRSRQLRFDPGAFFGLRRAERDLGQQVQESLSPWRRGGGRLSRPGQNDRFRRGQPVPQLRGSDRLPGRGRVESRGGPLPWRDHRQPHPHPGAQPSDGSAGGRADRPRLLGTAVQFD